MAHLYRSFWCVLVVFCFAVPRATGQASWVQVASIADAEILAVDCSDSGDCVAAVNTGWRQEVWRSSDGGWTWNVCYLDTLTSERRTLHIEAIEHPSRWMIVCAADSGTIVRSTNGGATWGRTIVAEPTNEGRAISFADPLNGIAYFAGVGPPSLVVTSDGGDTWRRVEIVRPHGWDTLSKLLDGVICFGPGRYLATIVGPREARATARSLDSGATWQVTFPIVPGTDSLVASAQCLGAPDPDHFFVTGNEYFSHGIGAPVLIASSDGGLHWRIVYNPHSAPAAFFRWTSFRDSLSGLAAGPRALFSTVDGGRTWQKELDSFLVFSQIFYRRGHPGLAVSLVLGTIYLRLTHPAIAEEARLDPRTFELANGPEGMFVLRSAASGPSCVSLYDMVGRLRRRRILELQAGVTQTITAEDLPRGVYLAVVSSGGMMRSFRLIR